MKELVLRVKYKVLRFTRLFIKWLVVIIYFILFLNAFSILTALFSSEIELSDNFFQIPLDERWGSNYYWEGFAYLLTFSIIATHLYWFTGLKSKWKLLIFGSPFLLLTFFSGVLEIITFFLNKGEMERGIVLTICSIIIYFLLIKSPKINLAWFTHFDNINKWHLLWLWIPIIIIIPPFSIVLIMSIGQFIDDFVQLITFNYSFKELLKDAIIGIIISVLYKNVKYTFIIGLSLVQSNTDSIKIKTKNLFLSWITFTFGFILFYLLALGIKTWLLDFLIN